MFDFSRHVAIVTGASGNLGSAVAAAFHQAGAKLVLVDRDPDRLSSLFPDIADSERFLPLAADLTDANSTQAMVSQAVEHFGQIDILANTVGGFTMGTPVHETSLETWDFMQTLNARTVLLLAQAVVPHMLAREHGKIIHTAARAALHGSANMAAYVASKSTVIRLTESMAAELKHNGITVNCVLPGTIDTPQNRKDMPNADHGKWVAPEAIADVFLFLASDAARAVTGASVPVYGRG
ncbi:MAG: SDR family oxidoreductase [Chloroflexi bacterium]|nr:SDR family oxidoreductase [Chloroflexota bacterium]